MPWSCVAKGPWLLLWGTKWSRRALLFRLLRNSLWAVVSGW